MRASWRWLVVMLASCGRVTAGDTRQDGDASVGTVTRCDGNEPTAIACLDFENTVDDDSMNHLHASATDISFVDDHTGRGFALSFAAESALDFGDSQVFDTASVTLEAWIKPAALPAMNSVIPIVTVGAQYEVNLVDDGTLPPGVVSCVLHGTGKNTNSRTRVVANQWSHVACTFDGVTGQSSSFVNGVAEPTGCGCGIGALSTTGVTGMSIAASNPPSGARARMVGLIDQVRIFKVARTAEEICADAGQSGCTALPTCSPCLGVTRRGK